MITLDSDIVDSKGEILIKTNDIAQVGIWGMHKTTIMEAPVWLGRCQIETEFIGAFTLINAGKIRDVTYNCVIECQKIGRFGTIARSVNIGAIPHATDFLSPHTLFKFHDNAEYFAQYMYDRDYDWEDEIRRKNFESRYKPLPIVGNDVWIGYGATIMNGVTIGDGAIIGAGAVVTKDVLPYTIVGGNPAKVIRQRFSDKCIEKLLELRWWDYGPNILTGLNIDKPEECIKQLEQRIYAHPNQFAARQIECDIESGAIKTDGQLNEYSWGGV